MRKESGFGLVAVIFIVAALVAIGAAVYVIKQRVSTQPKDHAQSVASNGSDGETPTSSAKSYKDYMDIIVPSGWTLAQATTTVNYGSCAGFKTDCTETPVVEVLPSAVNIRRGNYILRIDAGASQASGIEGGRFYEISGGLPSADAVALDPGQGVCDTAENHSAFSGHTRVDLFIDQNDNNPLCAAPSNGTRWYFSYIAGNGNIRGGGYFNYYKNGPVSEGMGYTIVMFYDSKIINDLPLKGSAELNDMLSQMDRILQTLRLKRE